MGGRKEEEKGGVRIEHAGRGKEIKILGCRVDGFDGENIYEFHGCYWHRCQKCFPYNRDAPLNILQYERTVKKILKLGNNVVQMWECEFRALKKRENSIKWTVYQSSIHCHLTRDKLSLAV